MDRTEFFDEKISQSVLAEEKTRSAGHTPSGKISASMMGSPTLWNVLKMVGVPNKDYDAYLLRKFARGVQAEDWFTKHLIQSGKPFQYHQQLQVSYRGGIGFVDLAELGEGEVIPHEVKSVTNIKFKRLTKGFVRKDVEATGPDEHHVLQVAYYALALGAPEAYLHYIASDDLRVATWHIQDTGKYQKQIDEEIDAIESALKTGTLPEFVPKLGWQDNQTYWPYPEFYGLSASQITEALKVNYPESYKRLVAWSM